MGQTDSPGLRAALCGCVSIAYSGHLGKRASGGQIPASGPLLACEPWARATLPGTEQILTGWFSLISVVGPPGGQPSSGPVSADGGLGAG